ncbi:DNA/RNA non-specific endonuclease [Bacillus anthracis]|uniref:DNA/RNA non-specific endonuclease n=1 Tax=Bacillus anthracis TaxID=1392 RepID=UPI003D21DC48
MIKGEYKLKPNIKYTSNGYSYSTDDIGRIDNAQGKLQLGQGKRNSTHQVKVGGEDRNKGNHGGHLIAHIFGGSGLVDNMVPMNGKLVTKVHTGN